MILNFGYGVFCVVLFSLDFRMFALHVSSKQVLADEGGASRSIRTNLTNVRSDATMANFVPFAFVPPQKSCRTKKSDSLV